MLFSTLLYFSGLWSSLETSRTLRVTCRTICGHVDGAREFLHTARTFACACGACKTSGGGETFLGDVEGRTEDLPAFERGIIEVRKGIERVSGSDADEHGTAGIPGVARRILGVDLHLGRKLRDAAAFDLEEAAVVLQTVYRLDAMLSIARARAEHGFCWSSFMAVGDAKGASGDASGVGIELLGLRHPFLPGSVENDWRLGRRFGAPNAILTGPNAGGKSTIMKSVLYAVLLSQTLTIAPCSGACALTPLAVVSSHLNVADRTGTESLFQAEMGRAQRVIAQLPDSFGAPNESGRGLCALVVLDEMFSSTNPTEGVAAAAACAARLAAHPGCISIISTHHVALCRVLTRRQFVPFSMPVRIGPDGGVVGHPYRLRRGICRQYVAIELLRGAGFDEGIVEEAVAIKNQLVNRRRKPCNKKAIKKSPK